MVWRLGRGSGSWDNGVFFLTPPQVSFPRALGKSFHHCPCHPGCAIAGLPGGSWMWHSGKLLSPRDVTELSLSWRAAVLVWEVLGEPLRSKSPCINSWGNVSPLPHTRCVRAFPVACPEQCHALLWALLVVQRQPEIFLSSNSPLRAKIQALTLGSLSSPKLHQPFLMLWIYCFS